MADNQIQGRAKKFDGTPIDYVSIFNWNDGKCIAQVTPDASGNWTYAYTESVKVGITYVADGCEPITHGYYDFVIEEIPGIPSGFLMLIVASGRGTYAVQYDKLANAHANWDVNFAPVMDIGLLSYVATPSGDAFSTPEPKVIDEFNLAWNLEVMAFASADYDRTNFLMEFLDAANAVIFSFRVDEGYYTTPSFYKAPADPVWTQVPTTGVYTQLFGVFTFTESSVIFTNKKGGNFINSFSTSVNLTTVAKVRFSGKASSRYASTTGSYVRLLPTPN